MDVKAAKTAIAGCLGTLQQMDSLTGLPYSPVRYVRSNAQAPFSISEPDLPTWIIFTGSANYPDPPDRTDGRLAREQRDFMACLYVCVANSGIDGEAERKVEPYLDPTRQLIQQHPLFYDNNIADIVPGILRAYPVRDDGIIQLRYGQDTTLYLGLRFTIRVIALNANTYGNE